MSGKYRVEVMLVKSYTWVGYGGAGSEHGAIAIAQNVIKKLNIGHVRVKDPNGHVVFMDSK